MVEFVGKIKGVVYISSSSPKLVEEVVTTMTNDVERLKGELKGRGVRIAALQKIINGQFDIMTSNKTQIEELLKENESLTKKNAELKEYNDNQAKTIAAMMCCGGYNISPFGYRTP